MILGIGIPYYKNSEECEVAFKKLMATLKWQITEETRLIVYEDGQVSEWLQNYAKGRITVISDPVNKGVAHARNVILKFLQNEKCSYMLSLDSDDMVDCDYINKMYIECIKNEYDLIESPFIVNGKEYVYFRRDNVAGCAISMDLIGDDIFDERYNISEDSLFIHKMYDKKELKIKRINSNYYYNFGINPNSLMKKFERSEIKLMRED